MKRMLTLPETAELMNRNLRGLRGLIYRKAFPCTKIAGRICVDPDELARFLALSRKTTAEEAAVKKAA